MIYAISATSLNNVIGKDNNLPWYLPNDLKYFKTITNGCPLVMGRKTYESLPGLLPGRKHIVVTNDLNYDPLNAIVSVVNSLDDGVKLASQFSEDIFISGGATIYKEAFDKKLVDKLFLNLVMEYFEGDTYFPKIPDYLKLSKADVFPKDEKNKYDFIALTYNR